jgi:hypothetical protein
MEVYLHCEGIKDYAIIYPLMKKMLAGFVFQQRFKALVIIPFYIPDNQ